MQLTEKQFEILNAIDYDTEKFFKMSEIEQRQEMQEIEEEWYEQEDKEQYANNKVERAIDLATRALQELDDVTGDGEKCEVAQDKVQKLWNVIHELGSQAEWLER